MCLVCIQQIIQLKRVKLNSGWRAISKSLQGIATENQSEQLMDMSLEIAKDILAFNFQDLVNNDCLKDFVSALVQFAKIKTPAKFK
jgi:hypothetical protein